MKVLTLQCSQRHSFEGWFGSEDDFQSQFARGLVECPICADRAIVKMPSAPRLNLGGHAPSSAGAESVGTPAVSGAGVSGSTLSAPDARPSTGLSVVVDSSDQGSPSVEQQAAFLKAVRHVLANTEDVGNRFAHQARAMHYGDAEPRSIRGQATQREAIELMEEGIDVLQLPMPEVLKQTLQ